MECQSMKIYLKAAAFALGIMAVGATSSANAHPKGPLLFNFKLTVKEVSDPQIYVGNDRILPIDQNTFNIKARQSDYIFKVQYQHEGNTKEAICDIGGVPAQIIA